MEVRRSHRHELERLVPQLGLAQHRRPLLLTCYPTREPLRCRVEARRNERLLVRRKCASPRAGPGRECRGAGRTNVSRRLASACPRPCERREVPRVEREVRRDEIDDRRPVVMLPRVRRAIGRGVVEVDVRSRPRVPEPVRRPGSILVRREIHPEADGGPGGRSEERPGRPKEIIAIGVGANRYVITLTPLSGPNELRPMRIRYPNS